MPHPYEKQIRQCLNSFKDPQTQIPLGRSPILESIHQNNHQTLITFSIDALAYPGFQILKQDIEKALKSLDFIDDFLLILTTEKKIQESKDSQKHDAEPGVLSSIEHVIAVGSGKGGVGKSTLALNLALAFCAAGWKVGLLDADIHGPSLPHMVGQGNLQISAKNGQLIPCQTMGLKLNSMGLMMQERQPALWRGPMVMGAFNQLLHKTQWGKLDILIIDLPPGTGDIHLNLAKVPLKGVLVVTTPEPISFLDAQKSLVGFQRLNTPVLGIVENMSHYVCPQCHHEDELSPTHAGEDLAQRFNIPLLGKLPFNGQLSQGMNQGKPIFYHHPQHVLNAPYKDLCQKVIKKLQPHNDEE